MTTALEVSRYLADHPDFFVEHPELLEALHVPHVGEGNTVSLVERQVKVLRERQAASRERLAELVRNARSNELLTARLHRLTLRLLRARSFADIHAQLHACMTEEFEIQHSVLLDPADDLREWLSADKPRCGHFSISQRERVFGPDLAASIASMALVPIGPGARQGVLALASPDASRFAPGMSTDFLGQMGELLAAAMTRSEVP